MVLRRECGGTSTNGPALLQDKGLGETVIPERKKLKRDARELLIKARLYRFFAMTFAVFGVIIFLFLYFKHIDGRLLESLTDIKTVIIILVPFLPAAVLAAMASRTESKFYNLVHKSETAPDTEAAKKGG